MNKQTLGMIVLWGATFALIAPANAAVYRTVDEEGNVVFTDVPPKNDPAAARVEVSPVNTASLGTVASAQPEENAEEVDSFAYELAEVVSPRDDEAVRGNVGDVQVDINIYPALQGEHEVRVVLDGMAVQGGRETSYLLDNVDRGTHTLRVEIIDADGNMLFAGRPSTFHLQRYAIPTAPNQPTPSPMPRPVNPSVNPARR